MSVPPTESSSDSQGTAPDIAPVYDGSLTPLTLSDEHGPVDIYLLPFLKPVQVRRFFPDEDIESYTDAMAVRRRDGFIVNVACDEHRIRRFAVDNTQDFA